MGASTMEMSSKMRRSLSRGVRGLFEFGSLALLAIFLSCRPPAPTLADFDFLITERTLAEGFSTPVDATFEADHTPDQRSYSLRLPAGPISKEQHFVCTANVAVAGTWLTNARWEEAQRTLREAYKDRPAEFFENEFPPVGARAMREMGVAGPGGASYGLVFTTGDGRFDVQLSVSNRAPEGAEPPDFDLIGVARRIADRYQQRFPNQ